MHAIQWADKHDPPVRGAGYESVPSRRSIQMEQSQEVQESAPKLCIGARILNNIEHSQSKRLYRPAVTIYLSRMRSATSLSHPPNHSIRNERRIYIDRPFEWNNGSKRGHIWDIQIDGSLYTTNASPSMARTVHSYRQNS